MPCPPAPGGAGRPWVRAVSDQAGVRTIGSPRRRIPAAELEGAPVVEDRMPIWEPASVQVAWSPPATASANSGGVRSPGIVDPVAGGGDGPGDDPGRSKAATTSLDDARGRAEHDHPPGILVLSPSLYAVNR